MGLLGGVGDFVSGIFGGGQKTPKVEQASTLTPMQESVLKNMGRLVNPGLKEGATPYSGTRVPGQNQLLSNYFSSAGSVPTESLYSNAGNALNTAMSGQPLYGSDMNAAKDYWKSAYYDPAMDNFMKEMLPKLRESYAGGTFDSGGRLRAEQNALADVATGLNSNLASIMYGEHQAGQNEKDLAANRALGATSVAQQFGQVPFQAGAAQYEYDKGPLEEDYQKWLMQQDWANPYITTALGMTGVNAVSPYLSQDSPSTASSMGNWLGTNATNLMGSMMGTAGEGAGNALSAYLFK